MLQGRKAPPKEPEGNGGYLDGLDLPSSSEESDSGDEQNGRHQPLYTAEDKRQDELKLRVSPTGGECAHCLADPARLSALTCHLAFRSATAETSSEAGISRCTLPETSARMSSSSQ